MSKYAHTAAVLFAVIMTIVLLYYTSNANRNENSSYLTNSFLSAYYSDTPSVTFAPAGDPYSASQVSETYYTCLFKAQVGVNSEFGCKGDNVFEHSQCIIAKTTSPNYKNNRTVQAILEILGAYKGDLWNLTALPSPLTTPDPAELEAKIFAPGVLPNLIYLMGQLDTPLTNDIFAALSMPDSHLGTPGCLRSVQQGAGILHDISPVYDSLWICTASIIHTEAANHRAYDMCIPQTAWPSIDVMQTPYSSSFLGSYNKHFALTVGLWIMCSFGVYSAWIGVESPPTSNGKPASSVARGGTVLTAFAVAWNAGAIVMVIVRGFGDPASANYFPMTVQTVIVTMLFTVLATMYFAGELFELMYFSGSAPSKRSNAVAPEPPGPPGNLRYSQSRRTQLGYYMRVPDQAVPANMETTQYTPLFTPIWSDCWVLCDGLITIGIIGYSNDVVTADLAVCFLYVLAAAATNSCLVRLLYHGYVNEIPATGEYSTIYESNKFRTIQSSGLADDKKGREGIRVMAMVSDIASLLFSMIYWFIMYGRYGSSVAICLYVTLASLVPTVCWLALNLLLDFGYVENSLYYPAQYMYIYNLLIRSVAVIIILATLSSDSDAMFTGETSLQAMVAAINSQY